MNEPYGMTTKSFLDDKISISPQLNFVAGSNNPTEPGCPEMKKQMDRLTLNQLKIVRTKLRASE